MKSDKRRLFPCDRFPGPGLSPAAPVRIKPIPLLSSPSHPPSFNALCNALVGYLIQTGFRFRPGEVHFSQDHGPPPPILHPTALQWHEPKRQNPTKTKTKFGPDKKHSKPEFRSRWSKLCLSTYSSGKSRPNYFTCHYLSVPPRFVGIQGYARSPSRGEEGLSKSIPSMHRP